MSAEIYYFSGTGNSLHIAQELQKRLSGSVITPIVQLLREEAVRTTAKTIGFVFPVHALTIPLAVRRFLRRADLDSAEYVFAVATRMGVEFNGFRHLEKLLRRKRKRLNAWFVLNMPNNDAREENFRIPAEAELAAMEGAIQERLDAIREVVTYREISREKDTDYTIGLDYPRPVKWFMERFIPSCLAFSEHIGGVNYFYADEKCTGCGLCEQVGLSQKIRMTDGKPVWQRKTLCHMCFACLNYCPARAVQIKSIPGVKSYTGQNGRYPHPYATAEDIAGQK